MAIKIHSNVEELTADTVDTQVTPLTDVVARILRDSQIEAPEFIEETKVPHGGE